MSMRYHRLAFQTAAGISFFLFLNYIIFQSYHNDNHTPLVAHVENPVDPSGARCPRGFYTSKELKPHLQRPPQDSGAPGANGEAFVAFPLSPEERDEKLHGFDKNQFNQFVSDRISLHRDLGDDTRHPE